MSFADPIFGLLFMPLGVLIFWRIRVYKPSTIKYSRVSDLKALTGVRVRVAVALPQWLRYVALAFLIVALMRPQIVHVIRDDQAVGIDIMLALDASNSMSAEDFKPYNRLYVAKQTIRNFIAKRSSDRIGLVVFAGEAFTQCPLTLDYGILMNFLEEVQFDTNGQGTAIGMAIATALNRLSKTDTKSKIIILLTDGVNNRGQIDPISAAAMARSLGVKIYTIGIGKEGGAPIPFVHPVLGKVYARNPDGSLYLTEIDEDTLKIIAAKTNGQYFRAFDEKNLAKIYDQIDKLEKSKIKTKRYYDAREYFSVFLWLAFGLIVFEIFISRVVMMVVP